MSVKGYIKQKTPVGVFACILVVLLILGYYVSGIFLFEGLSLSRIEEALTDVLMHPLRNHWNARTPQCMALALIAWLMFVSYYMTYHRNYQSGREYGSGEWEDVKRLNKALQDNDDQYNRILTQNLKVSVNKLSNYNMLVIGSSGSYKTTSLMHQNLLQFGCSYVVLDVKGDTQRKLGSAFVNRGYTVKSLNFKVPEKSDRFNPCIYIEKEHDLIRVVKTLQDSVRPPKAAASADPFWDDGVRLYLQSLFYFEWLQARDAKRMASFNHILQLINEENQMVPVMDSKGEAVEISALEQKMNALADKYGETYPPVRDYRKLKKGAPETVGSIVLMVNAMLAICETAEVKRIFSGNDIDIRDIGGGVKGDPLKKTVVFLIIPDNNNAYNFIISMFYCQMFDIMIRQSDDEIKGPLPIRVDFWMDEFYAGARPADTDALLGVVRSRNIGIIPVLQSISQIKTLFKDDKWETMMDNLAAVVYLGSGPLAESTHKFISEALGKATIDTQNDNLHRGKNGSTGLNFQRAGRELMTPEEVKRLPQDQAIVFLESRSPMIDNKAIPFDQLEIGYMAPKWLKDRYSRALSLKAYEHSVYTIYDSETLRYITIEQKPLVRFLNPEEAEIFRKEMDNNPYFRELTIKEKDLLYVNIVDNTKKSDQEIELLLQKALEEEHMRLEDMSPQQTILLQEMNSGENKDGWIRYDGLAESLDHYYGQLPPQEQELIHMAFEEQLTYEQINQLIYMDYEQMYQWKKAFIARNYYLKHLKQTMELPVYFK